MEEQLTTMPLWALIPFVLMLLMIALGPLFMEEWWEKNSSKLIVSLALGIPTAIYLISNGLAHNLEHQMLSDYIPFIALLGSLFIITGGIHLSGDIKAKPEINVLFLAIGYVIASFMGTTGAAMLLIRPIIATNSQRKYTTHTILFFIAAIANCGGLLTPLGDPPLFLLYLRGAEFTWFLNMLPEWALVGTLLLAVYYFVDRYFYKKENWVNLSADTREVKPIKIEGGVNFIFLLGVILSVAFINKNYIPAMGEEHPPVYIAFLRDIVLVALSAMAWFFTKKETRAKNSFSWTPIIEIAVVFLGIFITMTPALIYLGQNAASFNMTEPSQFYYVTGALSAFLDNAPTAVAFHGVAEGLVNSGAAASEVAGVPALLLQAISMGAVFFGAMTYIGNGPNFMVKSIAEASGIKMPSFFGYILKFSLIVLLPIYVLVQLIFLL